MPLKSIYSPRYRQLLERLKWARQEAGLRQDEAGAALGRTQSYVSKCETAARRVDAEELRQFATLYGKPLSYFLEEEQPTSPPPKPLLKRTAYTVRARAEQARRWARVARYLGCRSVSAWLEELADEQARRVEELIRPPTS